MCDPFTQALITIGSIIIGTGSSLEAQRKAKSSASKSKKEQEKANRLERGRADLQRSRERRRAIAKRRIQQAQIISSAQASGVAGSSASLGAQSALLTDTAGNIGFAQSQAAAQQGIFGARQGSANALFGGQQAVAQNNFNQSLIGFAGQFGTGGKLENFFSTPTPPALAPTP